MVKYYTCSRQNIGLDLDGTIRDFISKLNEYYDKDYQNCTRDRVCDWDLSKYYSIGHKIFDYAYNLRGYEITTYSNPYEGAIDFYNKLLELGNVWIITNQKNTQMQRGTVEWIGKYLSGYSGIIFTENKNINFLDVLIDDYVKNIQEFHGRSLCVARDWNESYFGIRYNYDEILSCL